MLQAGINQIKPWAFWPAFYSDKEGDTGDATYNPGGDEFDGLSARRLVAVPAPVSEGKVVLRRPGEPRACAATTSSPGTWSTRTTSASTRTTSSSRRALGRSSTSSTGFRTTPNPIRRSRCRPGSSPGPGQTAVVEAGTSSSSATTSTTTANPIGPDAMHDKGPAAAVGGHVRRLRARAHGQRATGVRREARDRLLGDHARRHPQRGDAGDGQAGREDHALRRHRHQLPQPPAHGGPGRGRAAGTNVRGIGGRRELHDPVRVQGGDRTSSTPTACRRTSTSTHRTTADVQPAQRAVDPVRPEAGARGAVRQRQRDRLGASALVRHGRAGCSRPPWTRSRSRSRPASRRRPLPSATPAACRSASPARSSRSSRARSRASCRSVSGATRIVATNAGGALARLRVNQSYEQLSAGRDRLGAGERRRHHQHRPRTGSRSRSTSSTTAAAPGRTSRRSHASAASSRRSTRKAVSSSGRRRRRP